MRQKTIKTVKIMGIPAGNPFAPAGARGLFCVVAWRIHDSVIRGEIDNRVKGIVRGKLWLNGLSGPVTLELKGNACADLAGCLHKSQAGLEAVAPKKLLPEKMIAEARQELFEIREGILKLMDEFRGRK